MGESQPKGTYSVALKCENCRESREYHIPKGTSVSTWVRGNPCSICGCHDLAGGSQYRDAFMWLSLHPGFSLIYDGEAGGWGVHDDEGVAWLSSGCRLPWFAVIEAMENYFDPRNHDKAT